MALVIETEESIARVELKPNNLFELIESTKEGHVRKVSVEANGKTISGDLIGTVRHSYSINLDNAPIIYVHDKKYIETPDNIVEVDICRKDGGEPETSVSERTKVMPIPGVTFEEAVSTVTRLAIERGANHRLSEEDPVYQSILRLGKVFLESVVPDSFKIWAYSNDKVFTGNTLPLKSLDPSIERVATEGIVKAVTTGHPIVAGFFARAFIPAGAPFVRIITADSTHDPSLGLFIIYAESPGIGGYGTDKYCRLGVYEKPLTIYRLNEEIVRYAGNVEHYISVKEPPCLFDDGQENSPSSKEICRIFAELKQG